MLHLAPHPVGRGRRFGAGSLARAGVDGGGTGLAGRPGPAAPVHSAAGAVRGRVAGGGPGIALTQLAYCPESKLLQLTKTLVKRCGVTSVEVATHESCVAPVQELVVHATDAIRVVDLYRAEIAEFSRRQGADPDRLRLVEPESTQYARVFSRE